MTTLTKSPGRVMDAPPDHDARGVAILCDVRPRLAERLAPPLRGAGFRVVHGPPRYPLHGPTVLVVEGDHGPRTLTTIRDLRRRTPAAFIIALADWWSEYEPALEHDADAVVHVPLRAEQIQSALDALTARLLPVAPASAR